MSLMIDHYLPEYHHSEIHHIHIRNSPEHIYPLLMPLDLNGSKLIKTLFRLRGLPAGDIRIDRMMDNGPFTLLEERPGQELVIGLLTDAWLRPVSFTDRDVFLSYAPEKGLKIAWNFSLARDQGKDTACLSTETRIQCLGTAARLFFSCYWFVIRPFSGMIRMEMLRIVKRLAEQSGNPE